MRLLAPTVQASRLNRRAGQRAGFWPNGAFGGGAAGAPSLDIRASVGTSTSPTSTGTKAVTVGFQPKAVLHFENVTTASGATTQAQLAFGAALSPSNRAAIAVSSLNGLTTSSTHRRHVANKLYSECSGGNTTFEADLASMDAGGFTRNWSMGIGVELLANHICLGGSDLEVSLTQQRMNASGSPEALAHGLSGAPTGVLFFAAVNNTVPANTAAILAMTMGAWSGSNQFGAMGFSYNGVTTTQAYRGLGNTFALGWAGNGSLFDRTMAVSSVDATNVNVTYPRSDGYQTYFWMLAIRGAKCQVGTFDTNASTSPLTINTPGITPKLFLPVFVPDGVDNIGVPRDDGLFLTIGASDGTNNVSCGITDMAYQTTTNSRRYQSSDSIVEYNQNGTIRFIGTAAFSGESVVLTPTLNAQTFFGQGGYLVLGS